MAENSAPPQKKRRWYNNLLDAYRITARSYPWIGWVLIACAVVLVALGVLVAALTHGNYVLWIITAVMLALLADMSLLSLLVRRAMYRQIEDTAGAVAAVTTQIKRGWIVSETPLAMTREKDIVWRIIGRPGVVLISEGVSSRVRPLMRQERKRVNRIAQNVPVHLIEVGKDEGQVPLTKLERTLRKLPKALTKEEVPAVSQRLNALQSTAAPIPKGIDPLKARPNRRAMRGR